MRMYVQLHYLNKEKKTNNIEFNLRFFYIFKWYSSYLGVGVFIFLVE